MSGHDSHGRPLRDQLGIARSQVPPTAGSRTRDSPVTGEVLRLDRPVTLSGKNDLGASAIAPSCAGSVVPGSTFSRGRGEFSPVELLFGITARWQYPLSSSSWRSTQRPGG